MFDIKTGSQIYRFSPEVLNPYEPAFFGWSVALDENYALIGSNGEQKKGSAYLFDLQTGTEIQKFIAVDGEDYDRFGHSVAINNNYALIGAFGDDHQGIDSGSAYLFDLTTGSEIKKLLADDGNSGDGFSISVSLNENYALIGAPQDNTGLYNIRGSAYLFDLDTGSQIQKITANEGDVVDYFGGSVALNGNNALIGVIGGNDYKGSAYVYQAIPEPLTFLGIGTAIGFGAVFKRILNQK